jgi:predicted transcriptional regulator of viral defense system
MQHTPDIDRRIGGKRQSREIDGAIADLAGRQHGVVARRQVRALGIGEDAIDFRLQCRRLRPLYRTVYFTGAGRVSKEARWMSAVLAGGPSAALSHRSAAAAWALIGFRFQIEVTVPAQRRSREGLRFHHCVLPRDELTTLQGIPITTVPRTLFDIAGQVTTRELERALNEADVLGLADTLSLEDLLLRYPRRAGRRKVRRVLELRRAGSTVTRSQLEERFLALVDSAGLPRPELNALVMAGDSSFTVDCLWRAAGVVVELDGYRYHGTRAAFESDRERDRLLRGADWDPIRVTWRQIHDTPNELERDLRKLLARPPATLAA